jgi:hypothetical protein
LVIHTKTAGDIKLELGEYELSTVIEAGGSGAAGAATAVASGAAGAGAGSAGAGSAGAGSASGAVGSAMPAGSGGSGSSMGAAATPSASDVTLLKEGGFIVLNLEITDALEQEGYVRDLIRDVQDARKKANFDVADRIALTLKVPHNKLEAVNNYKDLLCSETLTVELHLNSGDKTQIEVSQINNSCKIV